MRAVLFAAAAVASFHLAYSVAHCQWCIVIFLYCLFRLAALATDRQAFWFGLVIGLAAYAPQLAFFWGIFGSSAIALWCVLAFWLALFLVVGRACLFRFGPAGWAVAAPFLWTGLEYFRSELYYLRFSWLSPAYAFSNSAALPFLAWFGVYGIGFLLMAWAAFAGVAAQLSRRARLVCALALAAVSAVPAWLPASPDHAVNSIRVTGVQLEDSPDPTMIALNKALKKFPDTDLFVLSEYTYFGPVEPAVCRWCKEHHKWLIAGGEKPVPPAQYYNTAFVVGPDGAIAFEQAKCVPVQFTKDGLPAREQRVWNSPWGKLGVAICYDAGYTRVTDELIRQGAQALIFPTMDNAEWGEAQHRLHARIAPLRAAEYAVPVFRLCSSGISQYVAPNGRVMASAPFPGPDAMLHAELKLLPRGRMPPDRWLARISVGVSAGLMLFLILDAVARRRSVRA
jgi:apolipoprotein N-acyltransferase